MTSSLPRVSAFFLFLMAAAFLPGCPPDDGSVPQAFPVLDEPEVNESVETGAAANEPGSKATTERADEAAGASEESELEVVRVCTILPSSGPSKDYGAEIRRGIDIARSELGTGEKRRFEWTDKDTKSTEPGALAAFQACFNEGHHVVIGPVHPAAITALIPVAASHDIVLVIPELGASVPSVWTPNLVAIAPTSTEMGRVAARNARADRGFTKGAVLHVPGVFGEGLRDSFQKEFVATEAGGVMVEARELSPDKPEQWGAAAKELVAAGAEAIFVIAPPEPSRQVAQAVAGTSLHAWFIDWSMHPPVLDAAGSDGRGQVHWVNRTVPGADFESKYTGRHQARPEYSAGAGYDAAKITSLAANVAKSTWHEDISATMADLKGIESAFGTAEMVKQGGLVYLDRAGYRLIEPVPLPGTDKWVFGGFE